MNIFRIIGDLCHLLALILLPVEIIWRMKSARGVSGKSQLMFTLVFLTRYMDIFTNFVSFYNTIMKLTFIVLTSATTYLVYVKFKETYNHTSDRLRIGFLIVPCVLLAWTVNYNPVLMEVGWTFSVYMEAVSILPQLFMIERTGRIGPHIARYLLLLALYKIFYMMNWVYRRYTGTGFRDPIVYISAVFQTLMYLYLVYVYLTTGLVVDDDEGCSLNASQENLKLLEVDPKSETSGPVPELYSEKAEEALQSAYVNDILLDLDEPEIVGIHSST